MLVIGHRGAKGLADENTAAAIKAALSAQVDAIEVDVRLHRGEIVLSHDPVIRSQTYTTLPEALKLINGSVPIILEIKEAEAVNKLVKTLEGYRGPLTFSSKKYNKYDILKEIKERVPNAHVAVTEGWSSVRAIALASLLDTRELHLNQQWLWASFVRSMKHRGYTVFAYTVNNKERAEELAEWGVDGIFTDYPNKVRI